MTVDMWLTEHNVTTLPGAVAACRAAGTYMPASLAAAISRLLHSRTEAQDTKNVENTDGGLTIGVSKDSGHKPGLVTLVSGRTRRRPKDDSEVAVVAPPQLDPPSAQADHAKSDASGRPCLGDFKDESSRPVGLVVDAHDDASRLKDHPPIAAT
jgi:hypothetical protein